MATGPGANSEAPVDWKQEALFWKSKYEETRQELEEFTSSSTELEQELEKELQGCQQTNASLRTNLNSVRDENRSLKEQEQRNVKRIEALEEQIKNYDSQKQSITQYKRELEQKNDELETQYRNLTASFDDHAKRIEALIEEKALLENELEQTRGRKEAEQRLRDELRDLRDELYARNKADELRQAAQRERRHTIDQKFLQSDNEIHRLQSIASGDTANGHDSGDFMHKACKEREAELTAALVYQNGSKSAIQNLFRKITTLESKVLAVQKAPVRPGQK